MSGCVEVAWTWEGRERYGTAPHGGVCNVMRSGARGTAYTRPVCPGQRYGPHPQGGGRSALRARGVSLPRGHLGRRVDAPTPAGSITGPHASCC